MVPVQTYACGSVWKFGSWGHNLIIPAEGSLSHSCPRHDNYYFSSHSANPCLAIAGGSFKLKLTVCTWRSHQTLKQQIQITAFHSGWCAEGANTDYSNTDVTGIEWNLRKYLRDSMRGSEVDPGQGELRTCLLCRVCTTNGSGQCSWLLALSDI